MNKLIQDFQGKTDRIIGVINDDYDNFDNNGAAEGKRGDSFQLTLVPTEQGMRDVIKTLTEQ